MIVINQVNIKRILAVRTDRFGEFILNTPTIKAVKAKFPAASLSVMVAPYVREIAEGSPFIDEVITFDEKDKSIFANFKLAALFRKKKFDLAIILNPKKEFHIAAFLSGIPIRVGYNRKCGFLLTHKIKDCKHLGQKHEVEYNLDLIRSIGIESGDKTLFVSYDAADEKALDSLLKEKGILDTDLLITLHPWTSDSIKQWPLDNFLQLAEKLIKELRAKIIIIGGKEEAKIAEDFANRLDRKALNLVGRLTLRGLAALFKRVKLLISNDSGPVHLAAAVNTPVLAIFKSGIPGKSSRRWGPYGKGHIVLEKERLEDISVEEVWEKARKLFEAGNKN